MSPFHYQEGEGIAEIRRRVGALEKFCEDVRDLAPLTVKGVRSLIDHHGRDVVRARASIAGKVGSIDPHLRRVGDDSHITGKVGGYRKRHKVPKVWIDDEDHVNQIRYNRPMTRPGRSVNPQGYTTLFFSFDVIDKADLERGLGEHSGPTVSPGSHVDYIERIEAATEVYDLLKRFAPAPPGEMVDYQEREGAVATAEATSAAQVMQSPAVFTNIPGSTTDRKRFFENIAAREQVICEPSLTLQLDCKSQLMRDLRRCWGLPSISGAGPIGDMTFMGADAQAMLRRLRELGWKDERSTTARRERHFDASGVRYDPGKSGTVQFRIVGELPHEVSHEARVRILRGFCEEFERRKLPYVAVLHAPGPENDDRNWHFHLVYHDRPVAKFDATSATHVQEQDANGLIPASKLTAKRRALRDPAVVAQTGKWDFEVEWVRVKSNRTTVASRPFEQRKDRDVTRKDFVPRMRSRLCELTNIELELQGVERRVDPLSNEKAGRSALKGAKLHALDHARELAGIPTMRGDNNEFWQSHERREAILLEDELILQRTYVTTDERGIIDGLPYDRETRYAIFEELSSRRRDIDVLEQVRRRAAECIGRLESRPSAMMARNAKMMVAMLADKEPDRKRFNALERQVSHASEHMNAMRVLGGDLFDVSRDAGNEIARIKADIEKLEIAAGLRENPVFFIPRALAEQQALSAPVQTAPEAAPKPASISAPADLVVESSLAGRDTIIAMPEPAPIARSEPRTAGGLEDIPAVAESVPMVGRDTAPDAGVADAAQKRPIPEAPQVFEVRGETLPQSPMSSAAAPDLPHATKAPNRAVPQPGASSNQRPHTGVAEHMRKRRVSRELDLLIGSRLSFDLVDNADACIAVINPSDARRHGLPARIVALTSHEKSRLHAIHQRARARATLNAFVEQERAQGAVEEVVVAKLANLGKLIHKPAAPSESSVEDETRVDLATSAGAVNDEPLADTQPDGRASRERHEVQLRSDDEVAQDRVRVTRMSQGLPDSRVKTGPVSSATAPRLPLAASAQLPESVGSAASAKQASSQAPTTATPDPEKRNLTSAGAGQSTSVDRTAGPSKPLVDEGTESGSGTSPEARLEKLLAQPGADGETRRERPQSQERSDNQLAHGPIQTSHRSKSLPDQDVKIDPVSSARPEVLPDASSAEQRKQLHSSTSEAHVSSPPPASAMHGSGNPSMTSARSGQSTSVDHRKGAANSEQQVDLGTPAPGPRALPPHQAPTTRTADGSRGPAHDAVTSSSGSTDVRDERGGAEQPPRAAKSAKGPQVVAAAARKPGSSPQATSLSQDERTWRDILEEVRANRVLLVRERNGTIAVLDERMKAPAFAGRLQDKAVQDWLARFHKSQQHQLRSLAQVIVYGQVTLDRDGSKLEFIREQTAEAGQLCCEWAGNPTVRDAMMFLATLQGISRVRADQVEDVVELVSQSLSGKLEPHAKLVARFGILPRFQSESVTPRHSSNLPQGYAPGSSAEKSNDEQRVRRHSPATGLTRHRTHQNGTWPGQNPWD